MPNPRILLGFLTAHHPSRWWYRVGARASFLRGCPLPYVFVYGRPPVAGWPIARLPDELWCDLPDDRQHMILKNQALCRYALNLGYDFLFRCCDDTLVHPERLIGAGLEAYDYAGQMPCKITLGGMVKIWMRYFDYMHGGTGIWLSRKAMQMIAGAKFESMVCDMPAEVELGFGLKGKGHNVWWDDLAIGEILKGRLAWDDPIRNVPADAYTRNGISVFEDEMLFWNPDPSRAISEHDPGVVKPTAPWIAELLETVKRRNRELTIGVASSREEIPSAAV